MKFHKEGYPSIIIVTIISCSLFIFAYYIGKNSDYVFVKYGIYILALLLWLSIFQFFKSPKIKKQSDNSSIFSPAEGKIVVIEPIYESEYFKDKRIQVSIFMSPLNVHVNRYPISGIVSYFKYHAGKYLVAFHPKSSSKNEHTTTVIKDKDNREIMFKQIAGALARRIVYYHKLNDTVVQQNQAGFIKFGSRIDVILPENADIKVTLNQKVKAGITKLAIFK